MDTKLCYKCNEIKPVNEFYKDNRSKDKLTSICKTCHNAVSRRIQAKNKSREFVEIPETKKCTRCKEIKSSKEFYKLKRNTDGLQDTCNECKTEIRKKNINRDIKNCENPDRTFTAIASMIRKRSRQFYHINSNITGDEIKQIYNMQEGKCVYCTEDLSSSWQIDHKIPLARNGTSDMDNLQCLCQKCNSRKSDLTHEEYIILSKISPDYFIVRNI